jgi:predicted HAD superfamily Cof-like phosphohydrolase
MNREDLIQQAAIALMATSPRLTTQETARDAKMRAEALADELGLEEEDTPTRIANRKRVAELEGEVAALRKERDALQRAIDDAKVETRNHGIDPDATPLATQIRNICEAHDSAATEARKMMGERDAAIRERDALKADFQKLTDHTNGLAHELLVATNRAEGLSAVVGKTWAVLGLELGDTPLNEAVAKECNALKAELAKIEEQVRWWQKLHDEIKADRDDFAKRNMERVNEDVKTADILRQVGIDPYGGTLSEVVGRLTKALNEANAKLLETQVALSDCAHEFRKRETALEERLCEAEHSAEGNFNSLQKIRQFVSEEAPTVNLDVLQTSDAVERAIKSLSARAKAAEAQISSESDGTAAVLARFGYEYNWNAGVSLQDNVEKALANERRIRNAQYVEHEVPLWEEIHQISDERNEWREAFERVEAEAKPLRDSAFDYRFGFQKGRNHLRNRVRQFMTAFHQHIADKPSIPPDDVVRLRARLIAEEAFEFLRACFGELHFADWQKLVLNTIDHASVSVDLPAVTDALADLDYVDEGTRLAFGIDGQPIADAVHAANMAKVGGHKDEYGKWRKPEGWQPPDIVRLLQEQGWYEP